MVCSIKCGFITIFTDIRRELVGYELGQFLYSKSFKVFRLYNTHCGKIDIKILINVEV